MLKCYNCGREFQAGGVQTEKVLCPRCGTRWMFRDGKMVWKIGLPTSMEELGATVQHVAEELRSQIDAVKERATEKHCVPGSHYRPALDVRCQCGALPPLVDNRAEETRNRQLREQCFSHGLPNCTQCGYGPQMRHVGDGYEYTDPRGDIWSLRPTQDRWMPFVIEIVKRS